MSSEQWALGIDIGGTNTKIALVSLSGKVREPHHFRTEVEKGFAQFVHQLGIEVATYLGKEEFENKSKLPIGVGVPNYSSRSGRLVSPVNLTWGDVDFYRELKSLFKQSPLYIENDANLAAVGERIWGMGKGCDDFAVVTVGTGIGTGIYSNGRLVVGFTGLATEGGHLVVSPHGRPCGCGGSGHFESHCSVKAIKSRIIEQFDEDLHYHEIIPRFLEGDEKMEIVFKQTAKDFAVGLQQIHCLFSPEKILLAGGGMVAGAKYLNMIKDEFYQIAYKPMLKSVSVELSEMSISDGAVLGAAALAFQEHNQREVF